MKPWHFQKLSIELSLPPFLNRKIHVGSICTDITLGNDLPNDNLRSYCIVEIPPEDAVYDLDTCPDQSFSMLSTAREFVRGRRSFVSSSCFFRSLSFVSVSVMKSPRYMLSTALTSHVPCAIVCRRLSVLCVGKVRVNDGGRDLREPVHSLHACDDP